MVKFNPNKVYIVFDGSSHYGVYGCDIEMEQIYNDIEVVEGPFDDWNDEVDDMIDGLNNEMLGIRFR